MCDAIRIHALVAQQRLIGYRTLLAVPMLRARASRSASSTFQRKHRAPFTTEQIELLKTFADQAVIAIENTRLFEAEQARKRELHRVARTPDRDERGAQRHQPLANRRCSRCSRRLLRKRGAALRGQFLYAIPLRRPADALAAASGLTTATSI